MSAIGQGYGSDAVWGLCRFFFEEWGGHRVELQLRADNERALRCYPGVGFQVEGRRRQVVPSAWGPRAHRHFLMLGLLPDELITPDAR
jgi:RimJ/RimL family protein N-acetyltransferase